MGELLFPTGRTKSKPPTAADKRNCRQEVQNTVAQPQRVLYIFAARFESRIGVVVEYITFLTYHACKIHLSHFLMVSTV